MLDGELSVSCTESPLQQHEFSASTKDVRHYGEQSGELNPRHLDDDVARKHELTGRISHGMLLSGRFTRLPETEFPGAGTIYLRSTSVNLATVYPNMPAVQRAPFHVTPRSGTRRLPHPGAFVFRRRAVRHHRVRR